MAEMLKFELVAPERMLASTEAEAVTVPGMLGELTAMAQHAPFLTTLRPGFVTVAGGPEAGRYFVTGGFVEISNNTVSVLAEEAVPAGEATGEFLAARIEAAEKAASEAAEDRVQLARQRVADLRAVAGNLG